MKEWGKAQRSIQTDGRVWAKSLTGRRAGEGHEMELERKDVYIAQADT